jgi:hypothetical protein
MHAVLQRYRVRLGSVTDAATYAHETLLPLLKRVRGFEAFYVLNTETDALACLTLAESKDGAEQAAGIMRDWFRVGWPTFRLLAPELGISEVVTSDGMRRSGPAAVSPGAEVLGSREQRPRERRAWHDRRVGWERRQRSVPPPVEQRCGTDRRTGAERRAGVERRAAWRNAPLRATERRDSAAAAG